MEKGNGSSAAAAGQGGTDAPMVASPTGGRVVGPQPKPHTTSRPTSPEEHPQHKERKKVVDPPRKDPPRRSDSGRERDDKWDDQGAANPNR